MMNPPVTLMAWPVIALASELQRKSMTDATSCGSTKRFIGDASHSRRTSAIDFPSISA